MQDLILTGVPGVLLEKTNKMFVIVSTKEVIGRIRQAVPFVATQTLPQGELVALPATEETVRILRNLEMPTVGLEPYNWFYDPPLVEGQYKAMRHQNATAAFVTTQPRAFVLNSTRVGKTASMVLAMDYLQSVKRMSGATLIVTTVSTMRGVWEHTINTTLPNRTAVVVHGGTGAKDRLKKLRMPADYYIINYDGVKMVKDELVKMKERGQITRVICDEVTHFGNYRSQRFVAMDAIINGNKPIEYTYGLTGSPGDDPIPIFGMCKLINPSRLPCKRVQTWQEMTQFRYGPSTWQWANNKQCAGIIHNTMQPAIRFDKKDLFDLPPIVRQLRDCPLSKPQQDAYEKMRDYMITVMESGEVIEAVHKASLSQKLFQIALGTAIAEDKLVDLDNKPRLDTLVEVIEEASAKVVIFCPYTGVIARLKKQLAERKYTVEVVDGNVTGKRRDKIFHAFQNQKDPHILIAHPQTTAFGVELAAADTIIFNGPPLSGGFIYEQALERLSSLKQKASQISIIQVAATPEERTFFTGLDNGVRTSELINNMFANFTRK